MSWSRWRKGHQKVRDSRNDKEDATLPQELVDEFMSYLHDTSANLKACALVCQSVLVYSPASPPHLINHIQTLILHRDPEFEVEEFEKFCNLPFTQLENVSIFHHFSPLTLRSATALQRLFRLPSLLLVEMQCSSLEPEAFPVIWDCSPTIRHLQLYRWDHSPDSFHPSQRHSSASIVLESLKLENVYGLEGWLNDALCPFDISQLAVLSFGIHNSVLDWRRIEPAFQTIQALEFTISDKRDQGVVADLSLFPNLLFLRMQIHGLDATRALSTLSTLTPSSRICQNVFHIPTPTSENCGQLHFKVAGLSLQHLQTVGLEMDPKLYDRWAKTFPRLRSRNLLYCSDDDWFQTQIRRRKSLQ
ncbi:hypothetical protein MVEN_01236500 [Mycena venus]|uniref:Uncharacterized protein n=1 Tax=Mycena venus TaxID=2733690 RepID=A0A8H7CWB0_9AGAR|nr:hypothetical protein MVEN_01236500 [Mycena venus]